MMRPRHFLDIEPVYFSDQENNSDKQLERMAYLIRRNPQGLLLHLQRIFYCFQTDNQAHLYVSVVDLFLVLKHKGKQLAERVLLHSQAKLTDDQFRQLSAMLDTPVQKTSVMSGSALEYASVEPLPLIKKSDLQQQIDDTEQIVEDFIEYSQLDEAMDFLEKRLLSTGLSDAMQKQLLELYQRTDSMEQFRDFIILAKEFECKLVPDWQHFEQQLSAST